MKKENRVQLGDDAVRNSRKLSGAAAASHTQRRHMESAHDLSLDVVETAAQAGSAARASGASFRPKSDGTLRRLGSAKSTGLQQSYPGGAPEGDANSAPVSTAERSRGTGDGTRRQRLARPHRALRQRRRVSRISSCASRAPRHGTAQDRRRTPCTARAIHLRGCLRRTGRRCSSGRARPGAAPGSSPAPVLTRDVAARARRGALARAAARLAALRGNPDTESGLSTGSGHLSPCELWVWTPAAPHPPPPCKYKAPCFFASQLFLEVGEWGLGNKAP